MKISNSMWAKMVRCGKLQRKHDILVDNIDTYFNSQGVDVNALRNDDAGGYVDMIDYGRGASKDLMETELESYIEVREATNVKR